MIKIFTYLLTDNKKSIIIEFICKIIYLIAVINTIINIKSKEN